MKSYHGIQQQLYSELQTPGTVTNNDTYVSIKMRELDTTKICKEETTQSINLLSDFRSDWRIRGIKNSDWTSLVWVKHTDQGKSRRESRETISAASGMLLRKKKADIAECELGHLMRHPILPVMDVCCVQEMDRNQPINTVPSQQSASMDSLNTNVRTPIIIFPLLTHPGDYKMGHHSYQGGRRILVNCRYRVYM